MEESLRAQRLKGTQNDVLSDVLCPHWMWFWGAPVAKSLQWAQNSLRQHWEQSRFQAYPQFITLYSPPYSSFLTVTRLKSFSPHGGGRFIIDLTNKPSSPGRRWCVQWPKSGLYLPCQIIFFPRCLINEKSIMMWMRTCGQIHKTGLIKNIKCIEEHSSWHFTIGLL